MNEAHTRRRFLAAMGTVPLAAILERGFLRAGGGRHRIVPLYLQRHTLSCEMAALHMVAEYFGRTLTEETLIEMLPVHDAPPRLASDGSMIWGDPHRAFVGSIDGKQIYHDALEKYPPGARKAWEWGYGVYPEVIAEVATRLNLPVYGVDSIEDVYWHLERGRPVIPIVPYGGDTKAVEWSWFTERGDRIRVIDGEHSVVVRPDRDEKYVYVNDPTLYAGDRVSRYTHEDFARAFEILSMAVAIGKPSWVIPANIV